LSGWAATRRSTSTCAWWRPPTAICAPALEDGTFREDLYYRLNVVPMEIPPLRERKEDIPYLCHHFVRKLAPEMGNQVRSITDAAIDKLMQYSWPGNVRELENVIERSMVMAWGTSWTPTISGST
jgi:transcriptional regulator with PAS, ATPase and Fis domain